MNNFSRFIWLRMGLFAARWLTFSSVTVASEVDGSFPSGWTETPVPHRIPYIIFPRLILVNDGFMMVSERLVMIETIGNVDCECCPFLVGQCSLETIINPHSTGNCLIICWLLGHAFIPPPDILNITITTGPSGADQLSIDTKHSEENVSSKPCWYHGSYMFLPFATRHQSVSSSSPSHHPIPPALGEVVYRMGGQFWPSRCYARLMGELLVIHRSGKQRLGSCPWCWSRSSMVSRGSSDHS